MTVILTEQSTLATNGNSLNVNLLKTYSFFIISKDLKKIDERSLLIKHGTLTGYTHNGSNWFIETSGSKKDVPPTDKATVGQISWNTFTENIENFLNNIKDKTEITKEDIEVLYAIDPKLEKLLEPFAAYHPLANLTTDLKAKKTELQNYVNTKLGK